MMTVNKAEVQAQHDTDQCDTDITVLLSEMTEDTEIGQPVDPKLAEALKKVWQKNIAKDRIKNSLKKQLTPTILFINYWENCENRYCSAFPQAM